MLLSIADIIFLCVSGMKIFQHDVKANVNSQTLNVTYPAPISTVCVSVEELMMVVSTVRTS